MAGRLVRERCLTVLILGRLPFSMQPMLQIDDKEVILAKKILLGKSCHSSGCAAYRS
jgi:hypothetical protein